MKLKIILASVVVGASGKKYEDERNHYVCPEGYEFIDEYTCQKRIIVPSELKCPLNCDRVEDGKGDILCVDDDTKRPVETCPEGFTSRGRGHCVKLSRTNAHSHCPEGFHEDGSKCKREETFPIHVICKKGQKQQDDTCLLIEFGEPFFGCPASYDFDGASCVKKEVKNLDFWCQDGFWREGDRCVKKVHQPVEWRCPEHSYQHPQDPDRCARRSEYPSMKRCKIDGRADDECFYMDVKQKTMTCPMGFEKSHHHAGDGGILCEKCYDRKKSTSRCEYKPADMICPPDYYNSGHQCEKQVWGDFHHSCKDGSLPKWGEDGKAVCVTIEKVDKFKWCPNHSDRRGKQCVGEQSKQLESGCPPQYERVDDKCVMKMTVPRSMTCMAGDLENDKCLVKSLYPPHFYCPRDSDRVEDLCVRYDWERKVTKCPTGYFHGEEGTCYKTIKKPSIQECPKGTEVSHDDDGETVCVSTEICLPKRDCPWRFHLEGDVCVRTEITKAKVDYEIRKKYHGHHGHH